jgi:hypothetical protein
MSFPWGALFPMKKQHVITLVKKNESLHEENTTPPPAVKAEQYEKRQFLTSPS